MLLIVLPLTAGCTVRPALSPCLDGGDACAAARVPPGLRAERRGYRIARFHWVRRHNRESGVPDVGLEASWLPFRERF